MEIYSIKEFLEKTVQISQIFRNIWGECNSLSMRAQDVSRKYPNLDLGDFVQLVSDFKEMIRRLNGMIGKAQENIRHNAPGENQEFFTIFSNILLEKVIPNSERLQKELKHMMAAETANSQNEFDALFSCCFVIHNLTRECFDSIFDEPLGNDIFKGIREGADKKGKRNTTPSSEVKRDLRETKSPSHLPQSFHAKTPSKLPSKKGSTAPRNRPADSINSASRKKPSNKDRERIAPVKKVPPADKAFPLSGEQTRAQSTVPDGMVRQAGSVSLINEQRLRNAYNQAVGNKSKQSEFRKEFPILTMGVANTVERLRSGSIPPIFETMSNGDFFAIEIGQGDGFWVVPRFGVSFDQARFGPGAMEVVFNCQRTDSVQAYTSFELRRPAIFRSNSGKSKWEFMEKGDLVLS